MGGGSTIAAAAAIGYSSIGIEKDSAYFRAAVIGIPKLAELGNAQEHRGATKKSKADPHRKGR
jgi:hypothetical protein